MITPDTRISGIGAKEVIQTRIVHIVSITGRGGFAKTLLKVQFGGPSFELVASKTLGEGPRNFVYLVF